MTIQVYIEQDARGRFAIYSALTHAMLDTRTFAQRWQAEQAATQRGWHVIV